MPQRGQVIQMVSAGGVVYRESNGTVEVLLCGRRSPPLWALPKGTPDQGETLEETAAREVREETGLDVERISPLGSIEYWFVRTQDGARCQKRVHFYLMVPIGGSTDRHDPEFDIVQWFHGQEALRIMTYPDEVGVVESALALVRERRADHE